MTIFRKFYLKNFNPHSRTGSDSAQQMTMTQRMYFNPHSRTGSDGTKQLPADNIYNISTHTPARGVTIF